MADADESNVQVQPLSGGTPRQLTRFTDNRPVNSFRVVARRRAWPSRESTVTHDIVLFKGSK